MLPEMFLTSDIHIGAAGADPLAGLLGGLGGAGGAAKGAGGADPLAALTGALPIKSSKYITSVSNRIGKADGRTERQLEALTGLLGGAKGAGGAAGANPLAGTCNH
jgi:hypothetical protein